MSRTKAIMFLRVWCLEHSH